MAKRVIKTFERHGDRGWYWEFVAGGAGRTNKAGEGLFIIDSGPNHYEVRQTLGTCQFSLPADRKAAMQKVRKYFHQTNGRERITCPTN